MPRWIDVSEHGVAIRLAGDGEARRLVLESLEDGGVAEADAAALGFKRVGSAFVREGTQILLGEVRAVYPQATVREFTPDELRAKAPMVQSAPAPKDWDELARIAHESHDSHMAMVKRAAAMSPHAFARAATFRKQGGRWAAAFDGVQLFNAEAAILDSRKDRPTGKVVNSFHQKLVADDCRSSPKAGAFPSLCANPKLAYPGSLSRGRSAEVRVMKLIDDLNIADELMADDNAHIKLRNPPFKDLVIERHPSGSEKYPQGELFLTHYNHGNGDTWIDAEMVFGIAFGRLWFKETASQNPFTGGESRYADRTFANMFAKNLLDQGFGKAKIERQERRIDPFAELPQVFTSRGVSLAVRADLVGDEGWTTSWTLSSDPRSGASKALAIASSYEFAASPAAPSALDGYAAACDDIVRRFTDLQVLGECSGVSSDGINDVSNELRAYVARRRVLIAAQTAGVMDTEEPAVQASMQF